jgi:hypothetical protein
MNKKQTFLDNDIERGAKEVFDKAREQAIIASGKVLECLQGNLVETNVDGGVNIVKELKPHLKTKIGTKLVRKEKE